MPGVNNARHLGQVWKRLTAGEYRGVTHTAYTQPVKTVVLMSLLVLAAPVPTPAEFWKKLPDAKPGEWRHRHSEKPQTLEAYRSAEPVRPTGKRTVIYLLPALTRPTYEPDRIQHLAELMRAYFGREVRVLKPAPLPRTAYDRKRRRFSVRACLPFLKRTLPADGIFLLAVTDRDIRLPHSRFTYGWGSMKHRIGICSTWRVDWGKTPEVQRKRIYGLALHECTHMLSVPHCTERQCLMNGAMDVREADRRPLLLCWECRDKLCWNLAVDPLKRYDALEAAWRAAGVPTVAARTRMATAVTKAARSNR